MFSKISFIVLTVLSISVSYSATSNETADTKQGSQLMRSNGVQLWANNCARCHNMRSPDSYSDAQWNVAVLHMRVRANLTADDANAILEYLKSAN